MTTTAPGISAAGLDVMQAAACAFLESQGTARGEDYYWPDGMAHRIDPAPGDPAGPPAGLSAAVLEVMQGAASAFLHSQGTARRESYYWPDPTKGHYMDPEPGALNGVPPVSAAALEIMRQSAAGFLASQGTGHRDTYDWPDPHDQHSHFMYSA